MESLFYEAKPYALLIGGTMAVFTEQHSLMLYFFSVLLIACSLTILHMRYVYRRERLH